MHRTCAAVLVLAIALLLFVGESYVQDTYEGMSSFMPYEQGIALSFREFYGRASSTSRNVYTEVDPDFLEFTQTAHDAGTWLFVTLAIAAAALLLSFVPRMEFSHWVGAGTAAASIAVYAIWMSGAPWEIFERMVQVPPGHHLSLFCWFVAVLGVTALVVPLVVPRRPD